MKKSLIATALSALSIFGCSSSDEVPGVPDDPGEQGTTELPASTVEQIGALIAEKEARTPAQQKISSQLLYLAGGRFDAARAAAAPAERLESLIERDPVGRVMIDVKGDVGLQARIEALGGRVLHASDAHHSIRAWLPLEQVQTLAAEPALLSIRPAMPAFTSRADPPSGGAKFHFASRANQVAAAQRALEQLSRRGPVPTAITRTGVGNSEGSAAHGAERARKFFNVDGTGVSIGVLSDSDDFKEQSIATGDLPPDTVTITDQDGNSQDGRPGIGEGTAMMEIVHDVAPGATLFFATAFTSPESFADNIRRLRFVYGCDMIVDDVIYLQESPYQDDIIAQAVADVIADGAMFFSSAGNEGNLSDGTSGTWEGDFRDGGTLATLPSGYTVHDFGGRVISNRVELDGVPLLQWSDPGTFDVPQSSNDYDLFVLDHDLRNVLAASTDIQDGTGLPSELVLAFVPTNARLVIARHPTAETRTVRLLNFLGELALATSGASYGHNQVVGAFGTAAVDAFEAEGGEFVEGLLTPVELFSSDGNRRVFYDRNGVPLTGAVIGTGGQLRRKPEIAGADGVSTSFPAFSGLNPFFGTSAAAPHVAAIAGLLKSAVPTANASKIRSVLLGSALDIEATGQDRDSGNGIASAFNGLIAIGARPAAFLELRSFTAQPTTGDAILPGGSGLLTVTIANSGGAVAQTVRGTLSSSSPFVSVTSGSSNFANLSPGATASNTTPFAFDVSAETPCGAKLPLTLTVSFSGRGNSPTELSFGVQTGRSSEPIHFPYAGDPVAIPDADLVGVDVPLEVSSAGVISKLVFRIDGTSCDTTEGSTTVGVDHTYVSDLVFRLTSPQGTTVTLINQAGSFFNSGNNFCQTVLDDDATRSIQDVVDTDAPFTGTFTPANPESTFVAENADGTWNLNVSDLAFLDTGNVRAFSLDLSHFECSQ